MKKLLAIITAFILCFALSANSFAFTFYSQEVTQLEGKIIKQILPSKYHYNCIAITEDDCLYVWGFNSVNLFHPQENTPKLKLENVASAVNGGSQMAAVTKNGDLYMWGENDFGNLGDGTLQSRSTPKKIMENVASVSLSERHSAAITKSGELYMWGNNADGQIGDGTKENRLTPVKIMDNVVSASLNQTQSAIITADGGFYIWGEGYDTKPTRLMDNAADLCLNYIYGGAIITYEHELYCWGRESGNNGNGTVPEKTLDNVIYVDYGGTGSVTGVNGMAVTASGELYSWGDCDNGQLGNGTTHFSTDWHGPEDDYKYGYLPSKILDDVIQISCGPYHSAALTRDGSLYMWGDNNYGQLGNAKSGGEHSTPYSGLIEYYFDKDIDSAVPVKIMDNVAYVSVGCTYSAVITKDGELYMWGDNDVGQLGTGIHGGDSWKYDEGIDSNVPIKITIPDARPGDVNSDGEITLDDAVLTLQRAMNVGITGSVFNESAAGVNSDGEITLDDAIEILKRAMNVNS